MARHTGETDRRRRAAAPAIGVPAAERSSESVGLAVVPLSRRASFRRERSWPGTRPNGVVQSPVLFLPTIAAHRIFEAMRFRIDPGCARICPAWLRLPRQDLDDVVARHAPDRDFAITHLRVHIHGDEMLSVGRQNGFRRPPNLFHALHIHSY